MTLTKQTEKVYTFHMTGLSHRDMKILVDAMEERNPKTDTYATRRAEILDMFRQILGNSDSVGEWNGREMLNWHPEVDQ